MKHWCAVTILALVCMTFSPAYAASSATMELNSATSADLMMYCALEQEVADRIIEQRDTLGGFQSWDDLKELELSPEALLMLQEMYLITGIAADCNC